MTAMTLKLVAAAVVPLVLCTGPVSTFLSGKLASLRGALLWRYFLFQLFRLWRLPAGPELEHQGRHLLILGSSVAKGEGAEAGPAPNLGWPQRLDRALQERSNVWKTHLRAVEYTTSQLWYELVIKKTTPEEWKHFSVVVISLSVNNEGFTLTDDATKLNEIKEHFLKHMRLTTTELRRRLAPEARLVLAGPYANNGYTLKHLDVVHEIKKEMSQWQEVSYFIDLMQEDACDLKGHWPSGFSRDPAHPNSLGHEGLFKCLDLPAIFGDFW
eukprot:symbB.v1.2.038895.t1/scaffold6229.1/size19837/1